jgi:hypothetical protein
MTAYYGLSLAELLMARGLTKLLALMVSKNPKMETNRVMIACALGQ